MISKEKMDMLAIYNRALDLYRNKNFQEAKSLFAKCMELVPGDKPSQLYVERCSEFIQNPPPADWDGVYRMMTK